MSFEPHMDLERAMALAKRIGFDGYEVDVPLSMTVEAFDSEAGALGKKIRSAAENAGIDLPSICLGILWTHSLGSPDTSERNAAMRILRRGLHLAAEVGAKVVLAPVGNPLDVEPPAARAALIKSITACLPEAKSLDVVIGLENVCQRVLYRAPDLASLVDEIGSPFCRIYFDIANPVYIGLNPVQEMHGLGPRIVQLHLKDLVAVEPVPNGAPANPNVRGDFSIWKRARHVPLGKGVVDLEGVLRLAASTNPQAYGIVELRSDPEDVERVPRESLATLKRLLTTIV